MVFSKLKCDKCESPLEGGGSVHAWGDTYHFCKPCFALVEGDIKPGACERFMKGHDLTKVDKDMIKARKRRYKGKSPWNKPDTDLCQVKPGTDLFRN